MDDNEILDKVRKGIRNPLQPKEDLIIKITDESYRLLKEVLDKGMNLNPAQRFATAEQFVRAFKNALLGISEE